MRLMFAASALILYFRAHVPQLQETTIMMHFKLTRGTNELSRNPAGFSLVLQVISRLCATIREECVSSQ